VRFSVRVGVGVFYRQGPGSYCGNGTAKLDMDHCPNSLGLCGHT
jgi:hypothetical protein